MDGLTSWLAGWPAACLPAWLSLSQLTFFFSVVGRGKAQVIAGCRQAIKNNNVNGLFKIIKAGSLWSRNFAETAWSFEVHELSFNYFCELFATAWPVSFRQKHFDTCSVQFSTFTEREKVLPFFENSLVVETISIWTKLSGDWFYAVVIEVSAM